MQTHGHFMLVRRNRDYGSECCRLFSSILDGLSDSFGVSVARVPNRQIVQELKEGSRVGYRHLNELYQHRLVREAVGMYKLLREDAEEIVNDVLLVATKAIGGFEFRRCDADFHGWIMAIFRNRVRDHVRRSALTDGLKSNFDEALFDDEDLSSVAEKEVIASIIRRHQESLLETDSEETGRDLIKLVAETLEKMESWERVLLKCRAINVPYDEISRYTGRSVNQLKVYHPRVRKKLLKLLQQNGLRRVPKHQERRSRKI